jgi:hypothetical protein
LKFARIHQTTRFVPAIAAGVIDWLRIVEDIVWLIDQASALRPGCLCVRISNPLYKCVERHRIKLFLAARFPKNSAWFDANDANHTAILVDYRFFGESWRSEFVNVSRHGSCPPH